MAIFRLETKIIGRRAKNKAGKAIPGSRVSIVAKAAYRAGEKLHDVQADKDFNYRSRSQQVVYSEIVAPEECPGWLEPMYGDTDYRSMREQLWNAIEERERRVDSQLAREFIISLPVELDEEQRIGLIRQWCRQEVASKGFVADFAIHASRDGNNPHSHVLCTLRPVEGEGFGNKPDMAGKFYDRGGVAGGAKSELEGWRASWESLCNLALEQAGSDERVDHRSLKERGIDREPEPKIGVDATAMVRRGVEEDPYMVREARRVRMTNDLLPVLREIETPSGDAPADDPHRDWFGWTRHAIAHIAEQGQELLRDESSGARGKPSWEPAYPGAQAAAARNETPAAGSFDPGTRRGPEVDNEPEMG